MLIKITQPTTVDFNDGLGAVHVGTGPVEIQNATTAHKIVASGKGQYAKSKDNPASRTRASSTLIGDLLTAATPIPMKFPELASGRLLASLAAGSTATRIGLVVTVTAAAHGIPSGTFAGYDFFFPGCPELAAGWYPNFLYLSANTLQFSLPVGTTGSDFAGSSVNGGLAHTAQTRFGTIVLPANTLTAGSRIQLAFFRECGATSATKSTHLFIDSDEFGRKSKTTQASGTTTISAWFDGSKMRGLPYTTDAGSASASTGITKDPSLAIVMSMDSTVSDVGDYVGIAGSFINLVR